MNQHIENPVDENAIEKIVELLIENGADINSKSDQTDQTPLEYAIEMGTVSFR